MVGETDSALVDVRHCRNDENVACQTPECTVRWAKYVVEWDERPGQPKRVTRRAYLCRRCMTHFLALSEAIGAA